MWWGTRGLAAAEGRTVTHAAPHDGADLATAVEPYDVFASGRREVGALAILAISSTGQWPFFVTRSTRPSSVEAQMRWIAV